ncbi:Alpha-actinin-1 [Eumeta japonica]|uniref:Alpha-actinin-1 n=1 Tax=Eumeta variegata TaxID=151549 RepID=A0A4C1WE17_EUMVA|nr:Alpha-actinin-1 [Eumeta japonica]
MMMDNGVITNNYDGMYTDGYMEQEEEWEREGLLDPAWEKQQKKPGAAESAGGRYVTVDPVFQEIAVTDGLASRSRKKQVYSYVSRATSRTRDPLAKPQRGVPKDVNKEACEVHCPIAVSPCRVNVALGVSTYDPETPLNAERLRIYGHTLATTYFILIHIS